MDLSEHYPSQSALFDSKFLLSQRYGIGGFLLGISITEIAKNVAYRIGVDVGGINTDAAIINIADTTSPSRGVYASSKTTTTEDVTTGIYIVIEKVPPFAEFPPILKEIMGGPVFYLNGDKKSLPSWKEMWTLPHPTIGLETDGRETMPLDHDQIKAASILALAKRTARAFCRAKVKLRLDCTLYLTQKDGKMTGAATAAELPVKTFASGPTNGMTGAAYLAHLDRGASRTNPDTQVLVIDVGGTTSDVCALLLSGFPRQAPNFVEVGGVWTAFSMPEVLSVGLGGGSRINFHEETDTFSVGPESVGHYFIQEAMVFGGDVMTATDIVAASGADIGDRSKVQNIPPHIVSKARAQIKKMLERMVDVMNVTDSSVTLLLVGGAVAKVAGEIDVIEILVDRDEKTVVEAAKCQAIEAAVARGADRNDAKSRDRT
ncbi:hypothetical protein ASPWEDRAFT_24289 [Aspergillus wentii DTO 134E9]|uniref:Hydantoinase A/oxoprolinase domain-containing protein n=1 Tax=Aspergillus wentii DTO 134E9 TaxID=1073089 RepID=A0A1L9RU59_ASPWE|nr:uncharacterized protein ASPWEDRAFT_24289 [Aspergillus wentii DTO 134E9]OJJ38347.1 hypothetical protein ASPWEDRAFT_24289 [Aspergillus wentii DTO 134E9]